MLLRLRAYLSRPVAWGAVFLSYLGIITVLITGGLLWAHEADRRANDFCRVIVASHQAANADYVRLVRGVEVSKTYLIDPDGDEALKRVIRTQLPRTIEARDAARARAQGLTPPSTCAVTERKP